MILKKNKITNNNSVYKMDSNIFKSIRKNISDKLYIEISTNIALKISEIIANHEIEE